MYCTYIIYLGHNIYMYHVIHLLLCHLDLSQAIQVHQVGPSTPGELLAETLRAARLRGGSVDVAEAVGAARLLEDAGEQLGMEKALGFDRGRVVR